MKKIVSLIMLALVLSLAACTGSSSNPLIGKWNTEIDGQKFTINFVDNSKFEMALALEEKGVKMDITLGGTYTKSDDNTLNISFDPKSTNINIDGDSPEEKAVKAMLDSPELKEQLAKEFGGQLLQGDIKIDKLTDKELVLNDGKEPITLTK